MLSSFFLAGLICSSRLYFYYWDYLLSAVLLLALLLLLRKPGRISILCIVAVIAGLSFLIKFTGFILAMLLAAIYSGSRLLEWKSTGRLERILLGVALASGPIAYLVYNPSVAELFRYMRSSWNLASGYSAAMSLPVEADLLWKAALLASVLAASIITALWQKWISPTGAAMVAVTAWVAFKHGYVRNDPAHAATFFCFAILIFAFLLAQMDYTRVRLAVCGFLFAAFAVFALQAASEPRSIWTSYWWSPANNLTQAFQLVQWNQATRKLENTSTDAFRTARVNDYASVIRNSRVLFFPWEVSYGMRGEFHTVPLFALQGYSAYTHFLDEQSANHIRDATPPIDFVLLEWESIDSRNMLLDVPAIWNALYSIFVPVSSNGDTILLKHRAHPLHVTFREIHANACRADE